MTKQNKSKIRTLIFSEQLQNIEIGEILASQHSFELPEYWVKQIRSTRLKYHKRAYSKDVCPFGVHAGKAFKDIPLIDSVKMVNNAILKKAEAVKAPSRFFWEKVEGSIIYRRKEIMAVIQSHGQLMRTKSGYLCERQYLKLSDHLKTNK